MKKSQSLSKSFKVLQPIEIITEASHSNNDLSHLKVNIPKPRPPQQLPALNNQAKNKKIKIVAIK